MDGTPPHGQWHCSFGLNDLGHGLGCMSLFRKYHTATEAAHASRPVSSHKALKGCSRILQGPWHAAAQGEQSNK
jgi:hypothetical protein